MSVEYEVKELTREWDIGPHYFLGDGENQTKHLWWDKNFGEIYFANDQQKAIWMMLQGQLSDGNWENRNVDWQFWFRMKPVVNGQQGWKTFNNVTPSGEWPVDIFEIDFLLEEYQEVIQVYFDLPDYTREMLYDDIDYVTDSMGTSIRKIGYLE